MRAIPRAAREAVQPALDKAAREVMEAQRSLVPTDDGDLKRSIRAAVGTHELSRIIMAGGPTTTKIVRNGTTATYDYALAQEYGTGKMTANAFFWPGFRLARKKAQAAIKRAIGRAVKGAR